jgi:serine/threonine protein kinase
MSLDRYTPQEPIAMETSDDDGESLAAQYQMLEELGSGSFGVVYKAIERKTGEIVAVKHVRLYLHPTITSPPSLLPLVVPTMPGDGCVVMRRVH